jgi:hypothetical protein
MAAGPGRRRCIQGREHALIGLDGQLFDAGSGRAGIPPYNQRGGQCCGDHLSVGHLEILRLKLTVEARVNEDELAEISKSMTSTGRVTEQF